MTTLGTITEIYGGHKQQWEAMGPLFEIYTKYSQVDNEKKKKVLKRF